MTTPTSSTLRPGTVTAAVFLGYLESALLFLGGLFVMVSGWLASDFLGAGIGRAFTVVGIIVVATGVLYIAATRRLGMGRGRTFLIVLSAITVVAQVTGLLLSELAVGPVAVVTAGLVPPVLTFVLSLTPSAGAWTTGHHVP